MAGNNLGDNLGDNSGDNLVDSSAGVLDMALNMALNTALNQDQPVEVRRWIVSVEGLDVPARAAILERLHASLAGSGCNVMIDNDRSPSVFLLLLHRLKALSRMPWTHDVLLYGSWMLGVPSDPCLRALHADLAAELVDVLRIWRKQHLMVCLGSSHDEAFETALVKHGWDAKDSLRSLQSMQREIMDPACAASSSPFDPTVLSFECPRYAADNPETMAVLCKRVCDGVKAALADNPAANPAANPTHNPADSAADTPAYPSPNST